MQQLLLAGYIGFDLVYLGFADQQLVIDLMEVCPDQLGGDLLFLAIELEGGLAACSPTKTWPSNRTCLSVMPL